ncbi:MAG: M67 family metallopeptidase [Tepidisphaeraceae bacterium]|jgi:proteasome lid subunit RPN8/RPN11
MSLVLTPEQIGQIESEGAAAYPKECCGAMLGRDLADASGVRRVVARLAPLSNSFAADEQYHRFSLDPRELMRLEKVAAEAGLAVLGFYHSHPNHPARPSETDRQHAWPFYSYVIVAIANRQPVDLTSWQLDESTEQFRPERIIRQLVEGKEVR